MPGIRVLAIAAVLAVMPARSAVSESLRLALFEQYLDSLRQVAGIPGLSALMLVNREIVWEKGFGFQDLESSIRARPDTPYALGDLTEPFAATLLLQCVERGKLDLDTPIQRFSALLGDSNALVRHVLTHTSDGTPGQAFKYDPARFVALTEVSNACTGFGFRKVLVWEILERLAMVDSVPGVDVLDPAVIPATTFDQQTRDRFAQVLARVAPPYKVDKKGRASRSEVTQKSIDTSTGLISTVRDLARYDLALSDGVLLEPDTLSRAWTNPTTASGETLPHGIGWFVQMHENEKIVWHFGVVTDGYSSLIIKVPNRNMTLIMLANSDGLSAPFQLSAGDVTASAFARLFLRLFV
jgi:CubicO group peptidase (beta-lactamase class C family)